MEGTTMTKILKEVVSEFTVRIRARDIEVEEIW